ncbi:MAG TPA: FemAB family XrtA/PEP-CTERM system-associated protein [Gammaproteobacteria bacterium]|nr:FemAB family XrtA/PEP-CTERM system-associated protein [Gammaproteobacteria bacterium]
MDNARARQLADRFQARNGSAQLTPTRTPVRTFTVKSLSPADEARWDIFVSTRPAATFFHRVAWAHVIDEAFGHRTHYLYADSADGIAGILPLVEMKSRLFGHALVSTPFCVYGGIVADFPGAERALRAAACNLADNLGVDYLELRNLHPGPADWPTKSLYVTFRKALDPDPEANLMAIPRKQRAMIRKAEAGGLRAEIDEDVDRGYDLYAESVRNLGTPVFSRRYFRLLKARFGEDCEMLTVLHDDRPVSAVMSFYFRDEVLPYYGGGGSFARVVKANDFMYWQTMCRGIERGARLFDYGRSKRDTGAYRFKTHWGFEPQPLYYQYHLVRAKQVPDISPNNSRYRPFINAWQRLPLPVSRMVGPWIARSLG